MNIFDDDDFLVTTPAENFFNIARMANSDIVNAEVEKLFDRLATLEILLEEKGLTGEFDRMLKSLPFSDPQRFDDTKNSLFIEAVGAIVTQQE
jgi:hypothetical protein